MELKKCTKCGENKPANIEYFRTDKHGKNGLKAQCKECEKIYNKERCKIYYQLNKDNINKTTKEYYKANKNRISESKKLAYREHREERLKHQKQYEKENREKILAKQKAFRENNKELIKERKRKFYEENKERLKEKYIEYRPRKLMLNKLWRKNNQEKIKLYNQKNKEKLKINFQRRLAKKRQLPHTLTTHQWKEIKDSFNNKCAYCGRKLPLTQEHFVPLSKGGEYTVNNIIPSCTSCNCSKRDSDFFEWYPKQKFYSTEREKFLLKYLRYKENVQQLKII